MLTVSVIPSVPNLDGTWWLSQTPHGKDMYSLGYITAIWVYSSLLLDLSHQEGFSDTLFAIYTRMVPVSEQRADIMSGLITEYYQSQINQSTELYKVIFTLFPYITLPTKETI